MKHLISLMKQIEIELRSNNPNLNKFIWEELSDLTDWEYRIIQDFKLRVNLWLQTNNDNFVYKWYENNLNKLNINKSSNNKIDLLIVSLKRNQYDTVLTDIFNRVPVPQNLKHDYLEIWGEQVTQARNFAVKQALEREAKYLLFIDDDIIAPQGSIIALFEALKQSNSPVVAGQYFRKMEPLLTAHGNLVKYKKNLYHTDLCAMGFTLIDLDYITKHVPMPLFWEFGAPDGYWSMGEDAFFTRNLLHYTKKKPIVDTSIKLLHYDKNWKKWYGIKDDSKIYATNAISNLEQFEQLRVPPKFPLIIIATPTRQENDPIAADLSNMLLLRGYRTEPFRIHGHMVDYARTLLTQYALEKEADYILFLDDDIIPPIDGLCKLITNITNNKNIGAVSGDYYLKGEPSYSVHLQLDPKTGIVSELESITKENDLIENNWLIGLGFALIDLNFFKQARQPWFKCHSKNNKEIDINEDAHCTELLFQNGYKVLIDRSIQCLHVDYKNKKIYGYPKTIDYSKYAGFNWVKDFEYISTQINQ